MLKRIQIEKLFGLYNYDIELRGYGEVPLFLTGPNGYGKSTTLNIIDYVYCENLKALRDVPFSKLNMFFENLGANGVIQKRLSVVRLRMDNEEFELRFYVADWKTKMIDAGTILSYPGGMLTSLSFLLSEDAFYYIRDQRFSRTERILNQVLTEPTVKSNAEEFATFLSNLSKKVREELSMMDLQFTTPISEGEYEERILAIDERFLPMYKYGIVPQRDFLPYQKDNSVFLRAYVDRLELVVDSHVEEMDHISAFDEIINSYEFADKHFEINPRYGYRFVSKNEEHTLLDNTTLSSGERQILIQVYELLFRAEQDSFVLVDEPEISSHYAWQLLYLENMNCIVKLKNLQCLVATHSPMIFGSDYDLTVDLFEQHEAHLEIV